MARKVSNRKVGPKSKEHPTGKHRSLVQKVTYSYSSNTAFNKDEWARKEKEFRSSDSWSITPLLEGYKILAITYLENSPYDHTKCENWECGFTSKESRAATELDGGFEAAFGMLFGIYLIKKELDGGDMEKAVVHSLRLVHDARAILAAELEPLYHAGKTKTKAANWEKAQDTESKKKKAWKTYQTHLDNGENKTQASKLTMKYFKDEHNMTIPWETIRNWFKPSK
jgi:hypothetical protein